jgi:hypothetical protein
MHSPGVTVKPIKQISGGEFQQVYFTDVRIPMRNGSAQSGRAGKCR